MEERIYQGAIYRRNAPNEPWVLVGPAQGGPAPVALNQGDPTRPIRSQAEATQAVNQASASGYDPDLAAAELRNRELAIREREIALAEKQEEKTADASATETKSIRDRLKYGNILETIQKARNIAARGGVGWGSLLSSMPATDARALKAAIAPLEGNLSFDRLQEMRTDPANKTGGALGAVSERELALLGSTVASLDTGVSLQEFIDNLNRIERHFVTSQLALSGIDPASEEGEAFASEYLTPEINTDGSNPLSQEQQSLLDAFYRANPDFTAEDLQNFAAALKLPPIANADEIVAARQRGSGVAPAAWSQLGDDWQQGRAGQGFSGINEGLAAALGLPVDAFTGLINTTTGGMNWLNEAVGGSPEANIPRIESPVGGSDWLANVLAQSGAIYDAPNTDEGQFWRRAGQSLGAAAVPGLGAGRTVGSVGSALLSGAGGGVGAAAAQDAFPDSLTAEIAGELIGSLGAGGAGVASATRAARNQVRDRIPSTDELKTAAGDLYAQAEARGIVAGPEVTTELVSSLDDIARREALISAKGRVSEAYPKIAPVLKTIQDEAGGTLNPKRIQVLRETLADAAYTTEGKEQRIATDMLRAFDDLTVPLAPELAEARSIASRYLQARPIEQAIDVAENTRAGQFSQSGLDNALRTDFANLQRRAIRGSENFSPEVLDAISTVTNPSGARQTARWFGRLAPNSQLGMGLSASPAGIGYMAGEPALGALVSGATAGAGWTGRHVADRLARQQADDAVLMARSGGTMRLPDASDTDAWDSVTAALLAQAAPYIAEEGDERAIAEMLAQTQFVR